MPRRARALERLVGPRDPRLRLVERRLTRSRATQGELRHADLLQVVDAAAEKVQRLARVPLGGVQLAPLDLNARERRADVTGLHGEVELDEAREGLVEQCDRGLVVAEEVSEAREVVEEARDGGAVAERLEQLPRTLRVRACEQVPPLALRDERGLEERV